MSATLHATQVSPETLHSRPYIDLAVNCMQYLSLRVLASRSATCAADRDPGPLLPDPAAIGRAAAEVYCTLSGRCLRCLAVTACTGASLTSSAAVGSSAWATRTAIAAARASVS